MTQPVSVVYTPGSVPAWAMPWCQWCHRLYLPVCWAQLPIIYPQHRVTSDSRTSLVWTTGISTSDTTAAVQLPVSASDSDTDIQWPWVMMTYTPNMIDNKAWHHSDIHPDMTLVVPPTAGWSAETRVPRDLRGSPGLNMDSEIHSTASTPTPPMPGSTSSDPVVKDENGQDIVCVVCNDKSSGKHYGQYTCEG